jgi:hypothetical protein
VPLIEGMLDEAKRKRGADGGGRSHLNVPGKSVARVDFVRREKPQRACAIRNW